MWPCKWISNCRTRTGQDVQHRSSVPNSDPEVQQHVKREQEKNWTSFSDAYRDILQAFRCFAQARCTLCRHMSSRNIPVLRGWKSAQSDRSWSDVAPTLNPLTPGTFVLGQRQSSSRTASTRARLSCVGSTRGFRPLMLFLPHCCCMWSDVWWPLLGVFSVGIKIWISQFDSMPAKMLGNI